MKRLIIIAFLPLLFALPFLAFADDYVDDVYYSSEVFLTRSDDAVYEPYYNKKAMQEIIFIDDTTAQQQHPDTVRAIIKR